MITQLVKVTQGCNISSSFRCSWVSIANIGKFTFKGPNIVFERGQAFELTVIHVWVIEISLCNKHGESQKYLSDIQSDRLEICVRPKGNLSAISFDPTHFPMPGISIIFRQCYKHARYIRRASLIHAASCILGHIVYTTSRRGYTGSTLGRKPLVKFVKVEIVLVVVRHGQTASVLITLHDRVHYPVVQNLYTPSFQIQW